MISWNSHAHARGHMKPLKRHVYYSNKVNFSRAQAPHNINRSTNTHDDQKKKVVPSFAWTCNFHLLRPPFCRIFSFCDGNENDENDDDDEANLSNRIRLTALLWSHVSVAAIELCEFVFLFFSFIRVLLYLPPPNPPPSPFTSIPRPQPSANSVLNHICHLVREYSITLPRAFNTSTKAEKWNVVLCTVHEYGLAWTLGRMACGIYGWWWWPWRRPAEKKAFRYNNNSNKNNGEREKKTTCHVYDFYAFTLTTKCN